jgi:hypothetical protein
METAELSVEEAELLKKLEKQYPQMRATFDHYEISIERMPAWKVIKHGLTGKVLKKALKLQEPTLLLIPPTTRKSKIEAIDKHPVKIQKYPTDSNKLYNNNLWGGGKGKREKKRKLQQPNLFLLPASENNLKWEVGIVTGVQDVEIDQKIVKEGATNYEMANILVKKLQIQGLDVMEGADAYLTLMMKALVEGKPLDPNTFTALNTKNLKKNSLIAYGNWDFGQVRLDYIYPDDFSQCQFFRLRGLVRVDVSQS